MEDLATPCDPHMGRINERGYGTVGKDLAHRRAWADAYGPLPADWTLDHLCHDPDVCKLGDLCPHRRCKNLGHLRPVTAEENRARAGARCRSITHCPDGHEYAGDNLLISGGKRYCRICKAARQRATREARKVAACLARGHERVERTGADGRVYCVPCMAENARIGYPTRWGQRPAA